MKLIKIPDYYNYRIDAMFDCYKWDPQFEDANTLSEYALVLTKEEAEEVATLTEQLEQEHELELANINSWEQELELEKNNLETQLNEISTFESTWTKLLQTNIKSDFSYGGVQQ